MNEHPREASTRAAQREIEVAIQQAVTTHKLTDIEQIRIVNSVCSDFIAGWAKYALRFERHGDYSTPSAIAGTPKPVVRWRRRVRP